MAASEYKTYKLVSNPPKDWKGANHVRRLKNGFRTSEFLKKTGLGMHSLRRWVQAGHIQETGHYIVSNAFEAVKGHPIYKYPDGRFTVRQFCDLNRCTFRVLWNMRMDMYVKNSGTVSRPYIGLKKSISKATDELTPRPWPKAKYVDLLCFCPITGCPPQ